MEAVCWQLQAALFILKNIYFIHINSFNITLFPLSLGLDILLENIYLSLSS